MKKVLAALLVASFGAGLMAQNVVYDYKASIKRLDASFAIKKINKAQAVTQSYKVVSDTISGYVVLPMCISCEGPAESLLSFEADKPSMAYLVRKGDKLSKGSKIYGTSKNVPYVLVTEVDGAAALFGAFNNLTDEENRHKPLTSIKAANKAWMKLNYAMPEDSVSISTKKVLSKLGEEGITLGFLGLTNTAASAPETKVQHTGFGTAQIKSWSEAASLGWCDSHPGTEGSCQIVNTITGTLVGYPKYLGMCDATPMWDVCYNAEDDTATEDVNDGVICGTWTLKYNKTMTSKYNSATTDAAKLKVITDKLGTELIKQNYNQD